VVEEKVVEGRVVEEVVVEGGEKLKK